MRQGGLFSPFLFVLTDEGLDVMLSATISEGLSTSYKMGGDASINITHLQVAEYICCYWEKKFSLVVE